MQYSIVHYKLGRLRVRFGRDVFTEEEGFGIEAVFTQYRWVQSAATNPINGGLLLKFDADRIDEIIEILDGLDLDDLPIAIQSDESRLRQLDDNLVDSVLSIAARRYLLRFIVPPPLRIVLTIWRSWDFIKAGWRQLWSGKFGVAVLDAAAILAAMLQANFGTAASIMALLRISDHLEDYTQKKADLSLAHSLKINVETVWLAGDNGNGDVLTPMADVRVGDHIRVMTGSMIPLDGTVVRGEALVNEATLTGEPLGVMRNKGKAVFAGTVVEEGDLVVKVSHLEDNTRISKILATINSSESLKANVQGRAEKLADRIVPFSFITAATVLVLTRNFTKALSVLMVDYSCAIKLTTPICIIASMREASDHRMLVKGGKHLESFAEADTIVFDKTGTLTSACPCVAKVVPFGGEYSESEVLRIAACLEEHFPHSVARAIVREAELRDLDHHSLHGDVNYIVAHGISSVLETGETAHIGSFHFVFEDEQTPLTPEIEHIIKQETESYTAVYLAIGGKAVGMLCIEDPVRIEAKEVLDKLRHLGLRRIIMLTGDGEAAAKAACEQLDITEYYASVLPEGKADIVRQLKEAGRTVIMVGDGVNDSPALSLADISVALEDGSDVAKEVADITLLSDSLEGLVTLRVLSRATFRRIDMQYRFIVGFNTLLLGLGITGLIMPGTSALLHNVSTMGVSATSMRSYLPPSMAPKQYVLPPDALEASDTQNRRRNT